MAQDNQLVLEIVLDDGSIQRGFAKVKSSGEDAAQGIGSKFKGALSNIQNPTDILSSITLIKKAFDAVSVVAEKAFNFVLLGEQVKATNAQFEFLAQNAGIAGDALKQQLNDASAGLADTTDLLQAASEGFVKFGDGARRLPEVLSLARQVTAVFGGELTQNFENLNNAIAAGSSRALKAVGIYLDTDNVLKEYAKTLGITTDALTQSEKQQAILNATLADGEKRYKGVDLNLRATTDSFTRFKNLGKDALEGVALVSTSIFGPAFETVFDKASKILEAFNIAVTGKFGAGADKARADVELLKSAIEELEFRTTKSFSITDNANLPKLRARLSSLREELRLANITVEALSGSLSDPRQSVAALTNRANDIISLIQRQKDASEKANEDRLKKDQEFNTKLQQLTQQRIQAETESAKLITDPYQRSLEQRELLQQQQVINEEAFFNRLKEIRTRYGADNLVDQQKRDALTLESQNLFLAQQQNLENQYAELNKNILANSAKTRSSFVEQYKAGLKEMGVSTASVLGQAIPAGFAAFGRALATGQDAAKEFGKAFIGVIGGIAIQLGQFYIAKGIALLADPITAAAGPGLIAAGAGLSVLGGFLQGLGGGSTAPTPPQSAGGGGAADFTVPPSTNELTESDQLTRTADTAVTVNISGDVLDSDETGLRITKILNDAFDKQGVVIRRGVFA
jgi:hypothetical protein